MVYSWKRLLKTNEWTKTSLFWFSFRCRMTFNWQCVKLITRYWFCCVYRLKRKQSQGEKSEQKYMSNKTSGFISTLESCIGLAALYTVHSWHTLHSTASSSWGFPSAWSFLSLLWVTFCSAVDGHTRIARKCVFPKNYLWPWLILASVDNLTWNI